MAQQLLMPRLVFVASGALALGTSTVIFRDLTDFSQWVIKPDRQGMMDTYMKRHELAKASLAGTVVNSAVFFYRPAVVPSKYIWAGLNVCSLGMLFAGYINPELMMRERNRNALYVSTCQASKILKPSEQCIVTQIENQEPRAFPESQIMRPHVARVGVDSKGNPAAIAYCALTGTGIVYLTPNLPDGTPREFAPLTQLENNLVLIDKATGHIGHQINGLDETELLNAMNETDYNKVGRRLPTAQLKELGVTPATEIPSWRMPVSSFVRTYPHGHVFINDYKEFSDLKKPVLTIYDRLMDLIFSVAIAFHNKSPNPIFPTVDVKDTRLEAKTRVWGFNVGDDYAAVTETFVKSGNNNVRNLTLGGVPLVAAYDEDAESLGIWKRPNDKPIKGPINVHGQVKGSAVELERLNTVKNGLFWFSWQNFFSQTDVNPEK